jgi:transcriptional antiterminator NusG
MLTKTTLDPVQVRLAKGQIEWKHRREWRSKRLEIYFAAMLAPYGAEPVVVVPERFEGAWFVIQAQPSQERAAAGALIGRRFTCYLPMCKRKVRGLHSHHHRDVDRPMLPGYLFASFKSEDEHNRINDTAGVIGVLGYDVELPGGSLDHRPVPVPLAVMNRIRDKEAELATGARVLRIDDRPLQRGDVVQVIEGPFAHFFGKIVELLFNRERVKVEIDIFSRLTLVELDVGQLTVI